MHRSLAQWLTHLETLGNTRSSVVNSNIREERFANLLNIANTLALFPWHTPIITVGGTNGKGSSIALLTALFKAGGYRVGSFTSPHLVRYNERIQINQEPVSDADLCKAFQVVEETRGGIPLGYFEFTTLAGLWLFKQANLDITLLEVGLGGRLDPVNMMDADVSIISSIDFDHTHILGSTLEAIALEKAGIMRSHQPCIWGELTVPEKVKTYAQSHQVPLAICQKDFTFTVEDSLKTWHFSNPTHQLNHLPIPPITHLSNAACALQAVDALKTRLPLSIESIRVGLQQVFVPGRFQRIEGQVTTILDVAHNPASAALLSKNLKVQVKAERILMVIAVMNTKDVCSMLLPLIDQVSHWYIGAFEWKACLPPKQIGEALDSLGVARYEMHDTVIQAYQAAVLEATPNDAIVVMGSFHTVGAVLEVLS